MSDPRSERADCPDLETLAACIDDRLSAFERAAVEAHLADCGTCRAVLADTVTAMQEGDTTTPSPATPTSPMVTPPSMLARTGHGGWLTAAVAGVVLAGASWTVWRTQTSAPGHAVAQLVRAVGAARVVEPRLVGNFRWGPVPPVSRSAAAPPPASPEVEIAAAQLAQALRRKRAAPELGAFAAGAMMLGRIEEATAALEEATTLDPGSADLWSDLSAACLVRFVTLDRAADLPRSLEAAEKALERNAVHPEARFNRALALERLQLRREALDAWQRYLEVDPDSDWAREAREHIARLHAGQARRGAGQPRAIRRPARARAA